MDVDVHVPAVLVVLAEKAGIIALVDRRLQRLALADVLAADIDVGHMRTHGEARDHAALDQRVRIMAHDVPVLAGTRLGFVGVDDEVMRATVGLLWHEGPFEAGREAGATAATQAGGLHLLDDPVPALFEDLLGAIPMATAHRPLQGLVLEAVDIGKDAILIF